MGWRDQSRELWRGVYWLYTASDVAF